MEISFISEIVYNVTPKQWDIINKEYPNFIRNGVRHINFYLDDNDENERKAGKIVKRIRENIKKKISKKYICSLTRVILAKHKR